MSFAETFQYTNPEIESILKFTQYGAHEGKDLQDLFSLMDQYKAYKEQWVKNIKFDPTMDTLSKWTLNSELEEKAEFAVNFKREANWLSIQRKKQIGWLNGQKLV